MTVGELITLLKEFPRDLEVVLSSDQEVNGFHSCGIPTVYKNVDGELKTPGPLNDELISYGFTEEDVSIDGKDVVLL